MRAVLVGFLLALLGAPGLAGPSPQLVGLVVDANHHALESAEVTAAGQTVYTNAGGVYRLVVAEPGTYDVAISYADAQVTRTVAITAGTAVVDATLPVDGDTVIVIHDPRPIAVKPRPANRYQPQIVPPYSDAAIDHDVWARAWVLLDVDATGTVTRLKLLSHPGYGLDQIAVRQGFALSFQPARDAAGRAMPALVLWSFEWPSYWWLVAHEGVTTAQSAQMDGVPCRGSGPLHLGAIDPVYRDCSGPDVELAAHARWIAR